jgi:hypothetical protein
MAQELFDWRAFGSFSRFLVAFGVCVWQRFLVSHAS